MRTAQEISSGSSLCVLVLFERKMPTYTPSQVAPTPVSFYTTILFSFLSGVVFSLFLLRRSAASDRSSFARRVTNAVDGAVALSSVGETKMALVVRKDLKMTSGKIAAQCSHAAVAAVDLIHGASARSARARAKQVQAGEEDKEQKWFSWLGAWQQTGSAKVVLQCGSEEELLALQHAATLAKLPNYVIADAGRTQIEAGSKTVLAVGPAPKPDIDAILRHLKLL